jgi:voltage-gated potassium channel
MARGDRAGREEDEALETLFYHTDRVPFVHWQQFSGAKSTVGLVAVIAVLSFVVGLSHLSQAALALDGPLAPILPVPGFFRFAGVLFAFVLAVLTVFLRRRLRIAWYAAMVLLPVLALLPLTTFQPTDIPLLVLIVVILPLLVLNRDRFDQPVQITPLQIASLSSIVLVGVYGTVGSFTLRDQFTELATWGDAVYYVLVTVATVGYGDMTPTTAEAKWFALSVIVFGTGAFTVAIGSLIVPAIESRMASAFGNMTASELTLLEDHVIVLGHGDVTESLLEELEDEIDVVVVTPDDDVAADLNDEDVNVLTDDPTDEETLEDVNIDVARGVVVGTNDDPTNVLGVLTAREANPDIRIVAVANRQNHVDKLEAVGADEVISPRVIGGRLLGQSVMGRSSPESFFETAGGEEDSAAEEEPETGDGEE